MLDGENKTETLNFLGGQTLTNNFARRAKTLFVRSVEKIGGLTQGLSRRFQRRSD